MKSLIFALAAFGVLLAWPQPAQAKCVMVVPKLGTQILYNACDQCRVAKVSRSRPGGGMAAKRTYAVPAKSKITMTFKGPGRTRVESDAPCRGASATSAPQRSLNAKSTVPQCVGFEHLKNGRAVLKNSCQTCRQVEVDFKFPSQPVRRETYAVSGHKYAPLNPNPGATDVYIRSEKVCRSRR